MYFAGWGITEDFINNRRRLLASKPPYAARLQTGFATRFFHDTAGCDDLVDGALWEYDRMW